MSSIIYETINLFNQKNNILPYRYIGSDQHNNPNYFGSSKELLKDIKKIGKENFQKNVLCEFNYDIDNVTLRKLESDIQKSIDVACNPEYYNKTNTSHKGYVENLEQRKLRMEKTRKGREIWWNNLTEEQKNKEYEKNRKSIMDYNNSIKGKTYDEIYGIEKSQQKKKKHMGKNNGKSKQIIDVQTGKIFDTMKDAMNYYGIKKYVTLKNRCIKEKEMKFL
jgi:hypothetical protein